MNLWQTPKQIGTTIKNAARLRKIVSVFAKNGFQDVAQRINLSAFITGRSSERETRHLSTAQRIRLSFEELGPTFIKLGQLLATRPDIIPPDYVQEFRRLQDQIPPVDFAEVERVLDEQYPQGYQKVFAEFSTSALGGASMAQVHRATLLDGRPVVVKVQRPGIAQTIEDDIRILQLIADLVEDYIPEARIFNPVGMVSEFARSISLETNFIVEANNIKRFQENFIDFPQVKIPEIFLNLSGPKVLVMEELKGIPMSQPEAFAESESDREELMRIGLKAYFKMVFVDGLFHGDLHGGNLFVMPERQIGIVDFGLVGRLSKATQKSIASMFMALLNEDFERLAYEYVELAPFNTKTNRQLLAQDLRSVLAPFFGLNLRNVNMGRLLLESSRVAAKHHVVLPTELMLFFKSTVTLEGLGRALDDDFDLLPFVREFSQDLLRSKVKPQELFAEASFQMREWTALLEALPKEARIHLRKMNQPGYSKRVEIKELEALERALAGVGRLIFVGLVISALLLVGAQTLSYEGGGDFYGFPLLSAIFFALAGLLFIRFFLKRT